MQQAIYDALLHDLYRSVLDERYLEGFVQRLGEAFPGVLVAFHIELIAREPPVLAVSGSRQRAYTANLGEEAIDAYADHYGQMNPWVTGLSWAPSDQVLHSEMSLETEAFLHTEFYGDFMRRQGDVRTSDALLARRDERTMAGLAMSVPHSREETDRPVICELLAHLRPHLQLATELVVRNLETNGARRLSSASLDQITDPALAVEETGKILIANAAADRLLQSAILTISPEGQLLAPTIDPGASLAPSIASVLRRGAGSALVPLSGASGGGGPALACIMTLAREEPEHPLEVFLSGWRARALVVFFGLEVPPDAIDEALLGELFQLTPAEAELAIAISRGMSIEEVSARRGISRNTARNQLSSIFVKTGVSRQAHLATLVQRALALRRVRG